MKLSSHALHQWFPWIRRFLLLTSIIYQVIGVSILGITLWLYAESRRQFSAGFDGKLKQGTTSNVFKVLHDHDEAIRQGLHTAIIILVVYGFLFIVSGIIGFYGSLTQRMSPLLWFTGLAWAGLTLTAVSWFFIYHTPTRSAGFGNRFEMYSNEFNGNGLMSFAHAQNIQTFFKCCGLQGYEDWLLIQPKETIVNGLSSCCIYEEKNNTCYKDLQLIDSAIYGDKTRMSQLIYTEGCYIKLMTVLEKMSTLHFVLTPVLLVAFTTNVIGLSLSFPFCIILSYISGFNSLVNTESSFLFNDEDEENE